MQIKAIPFVVFDAGGVLELFDHESFSDNVIKHATADALAKKLDDVLERGTLSTVKLAKEVTNGQQKWLQFHKDFATSTRQHAQVPSLLCTTPHCAAIFQSPSVTFIWAYAHALWFTIYISGSSCLRQGHVREAQAMTSEYPCRAMSHSLRAGRQGLGS